MTPQPPQEQKDGLREIAKRLRNRLCIDDVCKFDNGCGCLDEIHARLLDVAASARLEGERDAAIKDYGDNLVELTAMHGANEALRRALEEVRETLLHIRRNGDDSNTLNERNIAIIDKVLTPSTPSDAEGGEGKDANDN